MHRATFKVLDGHTSAALQVTSGVPQGSILGPLLFIIFMNSIFDVVLSTKSQSSKIILYADDMVLYKPINNNQDLLDLQIDIDTICSWTSTNSLHHKDKEYPHNTQEAQTHPELFCREISYSLSNISEVLGSGDYRQPVLVIPC